MSTSEEFDLARLAIFAFMPDEVRDLVVSSLEPASYRFGSVIVREGNASDSLYIVRSGRARAVKAGEDGTEISLNTFGPGDTFGEMGLLHDTPARPRCGPAATSRLLSSTAPSSGL